jgi:hypothetical protein
VTTARVQLRELCGYRAGDKGQAQASGANFAKTSTVDRAPEAGAA